MIRNIRHTGIVVADLEKSLGFYTSLLGFKVAKQMDESGSYIDNMLKMKDVKVTTVKMTTPDGQMIELLHFQSHPGKHEKRELADIGLSHFALTVDDLDREYERLKEAGVSFNGPPQRSPDGFAKVTFCRAPEGTYIELVEELRDAH